MSAVFNLLGVLQLVIDGFNDAASSEHEFIPQTHQVVLHVSSNASDEGNALLQEG